LAPGKFTFAAAGSEQDAFAEYLGDRFSTTPYSVADVEPAVDDRIQRLDVRQDTVLVGPPVVDNTPTLIPVGTPADDTLIASPGALFNGQNDIVFTGAGNDEVDLTTVSVSPTAGNNRINTGSGSDTIFANKNDRLFGGAGSDIFDATDGQGGNRMSGGAGDDLFFLGKGDRALGGDGNDEFRIQTGGDNLLSGGAGNDQFWIVNAELPSSANTVLDFQIGTDVIGFSGAAGLGISATTLQLSQVGTDTAILFGSQTLATLSGIQATELSLSNPNQFVFA
jgi:Ca2+-binding RTX toxin-like protein